ncbi:hypothetical protein D0T50_10745 [Bacteroides sp. 214]|uniref:LptE family protein n=1 Tax=Bacteroides sp. 214 TaxID=2302935 RepID=UPI0013D4C8EB|nr:LptE family protein [Bacteroides sp. 214]NDW13366.1 hypothetical protein [Bacteroides sp. 214]
MIWSKKTMEILLLSLSLLVIVSCSVSYGFTGGKIDYTKIKTISIAEFPITSDYVYAPLGTTFNQELKDLFVRQTRLQLVNTNADLELEGEITGYTQTNEAVAADGYSSSTRLTITINVRYINNTNHDEDLEQQFSAYRTYDSRELLTNVQDGLIQEMIKEINDQIFNATVANW